MVFKMKSAAEISKLAQNCMQDINNLEEELSEILSKITISYNHVADPSNSFEELKYTVLLSCHPILYAIWERFFRLSVASVIKFIIDTELPIRKMNTEKQSAIMARSIFVSRFIDRVRNIPFPESPNSETNPFKKAKTSRGLVSHIREFSTSFIQWKENNKEETALEPEKLVMTFSNVDSNVVEFNGDFWGFSCSDLYKSIDLSPLNAFVGRRNCISHGDSIAPIGICQFKEDLNYVTSLISSFSSSIKDWLEIEKRNALREVRGTKQHRFDSSISMSGRKRSNKIQQIRKNRYY